MRALGIILLYTLCAPWDAAVLLVTLPLRALGARRARSEHGVIWLDIQRNSLLDRRWSYSTTLGHVILLKPDLADTEVVAHELVHARQYEAAVLSLWLAGATCALGLALAGPIPALAIGVVLGPWWSYFGASLAAFLRAERPYLDNCFERHARAETAFLSKR